MDLPPKPKLKHAAPEQRCRGRRLVLRDPAPAHLFQHQARHRSGGRLDRDVGGQAFQIVGRDLDVVVAQEDPGRLRLADAAVSLRADGRRGAEHSERERRRARLGQRLVAGVDDQNFARLQGGAAQIAEQRQQARPPISRGDDDAHVDHSAHAAAAVYSTSLTGIPA